MSIMVKLYGNLKEKIREENLGLASPLTIHINEGMYETVSEILQKFNIEEEEISHIFVNGAYCGPGKEVKDGDRIGIFPKKMALMFAEISHLNSIKITVKLFANLRNYGPNKSYIELPEGSTINTVLKKTNIPKEEKNLIFMINGLPKYDRNLVLKPHDTLAIFPPLAGG
ncbi:MAG: MoaD/ThiS family protein [Candidatus Thorarchaeota archaeon]